MLKSLFDKMVGKKADDESEVSSSTTKSNELDKLAKTLQKAFMNFEVINIKLDDSPILHATYLVDDRPTLEEFAAGAEVTDELTKNYNKMVAKYKPGAYFLPKQHILLMPLVQEKGTPELGPQNRLDITFYLGPNCFNFVAHPIEIITRCDEKILKVAFPEKVTMTTGRQYHRARAIARGDLGKVYFKVSGGDLCVANLIDVSAGGASFEMTPDMPELEPQTTVAVALTFPDLEERVTLRATIRNKFNVTMKDEKNKTIRLKACGIQFHFHNKEAASLIEEEVVKLQRIEIQKHQRQFQ